MEGKGQSVMARKGVGGELPVALAPTGNNLEQTASNVFIRS